jgi:TolA-binding protein
MPLMESESRSSWALGLSLVEVMLLLVFAALIAYVTDNVESRGQEPQQIVAEPKPLDAELQAKLHAATQKSNDLERQLNDMTLFVNELKLMVGAKGSTKEGFQEAVESLKRGYALCQKDNNTLIEATVRNGEETLQVIGEIPSDLVVNLVKGEETSDLDQIVLFMQDVYQYEIDHKCRFNYRLKYATDNDYRKAREAFEKYFYPEKMSRTG